MNNNSANNTTILSSSSSTYSIQIMYIGFAIPAVVANFLILFTLFRNVSYLKKSAFMLGLAVGDLILGIGVVVAGKLRMSYIEENVYNDMIQPSYCLTHITTLLLIGVQLPSAMVFLVGSERILAIVFFKWYFHMWSNKKAWMLTYAAFIFCTVSVGVAWVVVYTFPSTTMVGHACTTPATVGPEYSSYNFGLGIFCGMWAFLMTLFSLIRFVMTKKNMMTNASDNPNMKKFIKKQFQISVSMACIGFFDFALTVVPNILTSLSSYFPSLITIGYYGTCMLCMKSTINIVIYSLFHREFRTSILQSFGIKKNTVAPPATTGTNVKN